MFKLLILVYYYFSHSYIHKRPEAELLPLDTELEETLRNLKKVRLVEESVMVKKRETHQNILIVADDRPQRQRTMEDFWTPIIRDEYSIIRKPTIEANNFKQKPALITMV